MPGRHEQLPKGFHLARKGYVVVLIPRSLANARSTSFPLCIPLPPALPTSFTSRAASVTYTLYATVEVADQCQRRVLRASRPIQVVPAPATFSRDFLQVQIGRGVIDVRGEGGGSVELCLTIDSLGAWALEGGMVRVHAAVSNGTGHVVGSLRMVFGDQLMCSASWPTFDLSGD